MDVGQNTGGSEKSAFDGRGFVELGRIGIICNTCEAKVWPPVPLRPAGGMLVAVRKVACPNCGAQLDRIEWRDPDRNE